MINTELHKPAKVQRIGDYRIPGPKENIHISQGSGIIDEEGSERLQDQMQSMTTRKHPLDTSGQLYIGTHRDCMPEACANPSQAQKGSWVQKLTPNCGDLANC